MAADHETAKLSHHPWTGSRYGHAALAGLASDLSLYGGHHDAIAASLRAGSLVGGGELDSHHAEAVLVRAAIAGGQPEADAHKTILWGLRTGASNPASAPSDTAFAKNRTDARTRILEAADRASRHRWGRATSPRLILEAVHSKAFEVGTLDVRLSHREIAESAGLSRETVTRQLRQLEGSWLRVVPGKFGALRDNRSVFRILPGPADAQVANDHQSECIGVGLRQTGARLQLARDRSHDRWSRATNDHDVFTALLEADTEVTFGELCASLPVSRSTVSRALQHLQRDGLIERHDRAWRVHRDWALRLERLALPDWAAQRRRRHRQERELHRRRVISGPRLCLTLKQHVEGEPVGDDRDSAFVPIDREEAELL